MKPTRILGCGLIAALMMFGASFLGMSDAIAQAPKHGGTLKFAGSPTPRQLDPHKSRSSEDNIINCFVFESLTRFSPTLSVEPALATKWEASSDGLTWKFFLRSGVKFHNGRPMTADDVVFSVKRMLDPATGNVAAPVISMIADVRAVGADVVEFKLKFPYAEFPHAMAHDHTQIVAKETVDQLSTKPIGTGPFVFQGIVPGERVTLTRNPDYWDKPYPYLDRVVMEIMPEPIVQVTALQRGEVDLIWQVSLPHVPLLEASPKLEVQRTASATWDGVVMDTTVAPFNDVRVRQALNVAIDRKKIVEAVLFGYGQPALINLATSDEAYPKSLPIPAADPAKAKALLKEAGYPDGIKLNLAIPSLDRRTRNALGLTLQDMWRVAGINVVVQVYTWDRFLSEVEGKSPFFVTGWTGRQFPDAGLYPFWHSTGTWNTTSGGWRYKNAEVDSLLDTARREVDLEARKKIYERLAVILQRDVPVIIPYMMDVINAHSKRVHDFKVHPKVGYLDFTRVWLSD